MTEEIIIDVSNCRDKHNDDCMAMPICNEYGDLMDYQSCEAQTLCLYRSQKKIERLEQENKDLKIKLSSTKCYLCGEGFLTPEGAELYEEKNNYRSALEEIREILLLPDMPEVKEQTIITSTTLDEIVRANRENKLQKIKQTIYEVLNLS